MVARLVAKYKPPVPILACSKHGHVVRNLNSTRGVFGSVIPDYKDIKGAMAQAVEAAQARGMVKAGARVAVVLAENEETPDESTMMKIINM